MLVLVVVRVVAMHVGRGEQVLAIPARPQADVVLRRPRPQLEAGSLGEDPVRVGLGEARPGEQDADGRLGQGPHEPGIQRAVSPDDDHIHRAQVRRGRGLPGVEDADPSQLGAKALDRG